MAAVPPIHVLVIEDDADTRANLCDILELDAHRVDTAASVAEALDRTNWEDYSAVLLDRLLPDGNAEQLLPRLKQLAPDAAIMVVTGYSDLGGAIAALRQGAADYILKPVNADALRASLTRIAERRHLALAKERSETAFRTLVEAAPCLIIILRSDRSIAYLSSFAEKLTGYQAGEVLGKNFFAVFIPEESLQHAMDQEIAHVLAGVPTRGHESRVRCKNGSRRWTVWNAELLSHYDGGPAILAVGQDITTLKQAQEQALQSARLAAIGQMITGLAHESRNALQLIQASLEMLALEVEDRPEALELIASIQGAEDRLHRLFEDIRGYAAPIRLERDTYNMARVWRGVWEHLAPLRNGRQVRLQEHTGAIDLSCSIDLFSLERVFRNIFENALAACPDPVQIAIACSEAKINGGPALRITVSDDGPGLSPEQKLRIFEPFFTTKRQGTGLGMAIAKRIVEAHGGQISVGDTPVTLPSPPGDGREGGVRGSGAQIVITLPRETI
jgi:two-component system sensor kinase FixL